MLKTQLTSVLAASASLLSCFSTLFIIVFYVIFRKDIHNKRHPYILNLIVADFINSLNNTVSGFYVVVNSAIPAGVGCSVNGLVGQVSILAVDYSVLIIALITYIALTKPQSFDRFQAAWKGYCQFVLLAIPWIAGGVTGVIGYIFPGYSAPPGVNWCWLPPEPIYWRYALTHGHRITIMLSIAVLYVRLLFVLRAHSKALQLEATLPQIAGTAYHGSTPTVAFFDPTRLPRAESREKSPVYLNSAAQAVSPFGNPQTKFTLKHAHVNSPVSAKGDSPKSIDSFTKAKKLKKAMLRFMLFPTAYIIIWGPGMIQRALEAANIKDYWLTLSFLVLSQLLGFADALLYGWNENFSQLFRRRVPSVRHAVKKLVLCGRRSRVDNSNAFTYSNSAGNYIRRGSTHRVQVNPIFYNQSYHTQER